MVKILARIGTIVSTLLAVSVLIFGLQYLLPGNPARTLAGADRDPNAIAHLDRKYHLADPLPVRYALWLGGVLRGDLGDSIRLNKPVLSLVEERLPVTAELVALAYLLALAIGVPIGAVAAAKSGSGFGRSAEAFALWGRSTPSFWLGLLLILLFSVHLGLLPASGYASPMDNLRQNLRSMAMPVFVLGIAFAAVVVGHPRITMVQARGMRRGRPAGPERRAMSGEALLRATTLSAREFGELLSAAVLTEQVFTLPGFGKLIVDAVLNRDYAVVQGALLCAAIAYIALNLCADLAVFMVRARTSA